MSREEALKLLDQPTYAGSAQEEDMEYVIKKLALTEEEFGRIMELPVKTHDDYPTYEGIKRVMGRVGFVNLGRRLGLFPPKDLGL